MKDSLLSGYRALDLADEKGFTCGKILGALGVSVIKVEKPGGDPARSIPPFKTVNGKQCSLYWDAFNTDKRSITLNIETDKGKNIFNSLLKTADFVIESFMPGYLEKLDLAYEDIYKVNPGIVMTSISPFGQKGPYAHFKGSELIVSAMSGVLNSNGNPDRAPLREGPDSVTLRASAAAALGSIMALYSCQQTGEGQQVDVSMQEVDVTRTSSDLLVYEFDKRLIKRNGDVRTVGARSTRWIWACKDGYLFWAYMGGPIGAPANRAMSEWITELGDENPFKQVTNWDQFDMAQIPKSDLDVQQDAIARVFIRFTKNQIVEESKKRRLRMQIIKNAADILEDTQLESRGYWANIEDSLLHTILKYPKYYFLSSETENFTRRRAPLPGEHNDEIYLQEMGLSPAEYQELKSTGVI